MNAADLFWHDGLISSARIVTGIRLPTATLTRLVVRI
jgi:hypothetical protein